MDDLFRNVKIANKIKGGPPVPIVKKDANEFGRRATREKMRKNHISDLILKLKMITGSRSIKGMLYLDAVIKKIELVKELFILDLEQGKECFIPKELS